MSVSKRKIAALFSVQFKEFYRDFGSIFFSFAFPMIFVAMLVISNNNGAAYKFKVGIIDEYSNPLTFELVETLSENISIQAEVADRENVTQRLADGDLHALLVVPEGNFLAGDSKLDLVVDERFEEFSRVLVEAISARILNVEASDSYTVSRPSIESQSEFSFIFPGMLALALLQLGLFATASPILRARERGNLRYLLLTPLKVSELIFSQISMRTCVALTQVALLLAVGSLVVDISLLDYFMIMAVSLLGAVMLISIGYFIAGVVPSQDFGMTLIMFTNFAMMFGGNIFWDVDANPVMKYASYLVPVSYLSDIYRQLISGVSGVWPIWIDVAALFAWTALAVFLATKTFKFDMRQSESD